MRTGTSRSSRIIGENRKNRELLENLHGQEKQYEQVRTGRTFSSRRTGSEQGKHGVQENGSEQKYKIQENA